MEHETKNDLTPMTLAEVRQELKGVKGKKFWRSVDELADTAEFQAAVEKEFPSAAQEWVDPVSRRGFMKLMGASMALAGLAGCTKQPEETIYPYVKQPEDLVLGKPMYFATAHPFTTGGGAAAGQERRVPADQDRRQSRARLQPGFFRSLYAGNAARSIRSGPFAACDCIAVKSASGPSLLKPSRKGGGNEGRHRHLFSERDHYVAHAGAAVEGGAGG